MQRARCCAANAYDATSAFHAIFRRTSRPHSLRQPRSVYNSVQSKSARALHAYSTTAEDARQRERGASAADRTAGKDSRAQKLDLYEGFMGNISADRRNRISGHSTKNLKQPAKEEQIQESPWDAHPLAENGSGERLWKTRMLALSLYIREGRHKPAPGISEDGQGSEPLKSLDYKGLTISPLEKSDVDPPVRAPWAQTNQTLKDVPRSTAAQIFDLEIAAFAEHMSLTHVERGARITVRNNIAHCIMADTERPLPAIYTFGSMQSGLAMPYSDIDVGIFSPLRPRDPLEKTMARLYQRLRHGTDYICVVHRPPPHAIITAQHKATGLDVQIIAKGMPGKQDWTMKKYLEKVPNLSQLYTVVRTAFGIRGFVDPYIGGISAYGTFMMLAAALTCRGTPSNIHESQSAQLFHFLSFWADFDMEKYGMTLGDNMIAEPFAKILQDASEGAKQKRIETIKAARGRNEQMRAGQYRIGRVRSSQPYLLCLQDPADPINDLGGKCHAIKHIQATIQAMHRDLVRSMAAYDQAAPGGDVQNGDEMSFLLPLVGRSHELYAERRERMVAKHNPRHAGHHPRHAGGWKERKGAKTAKLQRKT